MSGGTIGRGLNEAGTLGRGGEVSGNHHGEETGLARLTRKHIVFVYLFWAS